LAISSLYINDESGLAPDNDFEGQVDMFQVLATSDNALSEFDKSTGVTSFPLLDELPASFADMISTSVNNKKDFVIPAAHGIIAPNFIRAVHARWVVSKVNGRLKPGMIFNGGAVSDSTIREIPITASLVFDRRKANPDTGNNISLSDTFAVGVTSVIP